MDPNRGEPFSSPSESDDPVPADAVVPVPNSPEQAGTKNPKKRYVRNKMDPSSSCVDSALEALARCDELQWTPIRTGLDFLRTFLTILPHWSAVSDEAGDLLGGIEDAFEKAGWDIEDAMEEADTGNLDALRYSLQEKIDHFKPRIRETYDFLSEKVFRTTHPPIMSGSRAWFRLYGSLLSNSQNLHSGGSLSTCLYKQFEQILKLLHRMELGEVIFRYPDRFRELCTQHGGVGTYFARLLFLFWLEGHNGAEEGVTVTLSDLLQRIKPTTPSLMAMYLKAIKSQRYSLQKTLVEELVGLTLLLHGGFPETLCDGLVYLVKHLLELPDKLADDEEIRRSNVERVICDAASLSYSSSKAHDYDDGIALDKLVQKAELLKLEILLIELGEVDSISKSRFESIHQGMRFRDAYSEKMMLILQHAEAWANGAESLNDSLTTRENKECRPCGVAYVKLSLEFYLTEFHAFLMEIMRCNPGLIVLVKHQIQTLSEGSKLFYKYSSILPLKDRIDRELILTSMDGAVGEAEILHNFYHSNQVTEHNIKEMSLLLSKFLEKFTLLNAKMKGIYHQFQSSTMIAFPKTLSGLGFVDFYLERLSGLMKSKTKSVGDSLKRQIEAVQIELKSLTSLLMQVGEKQNENPELKDLQRRVTWATYQADYVVDSILLLNGDGYHMLWLSDVIDEMKLIKAELMINNDFTEVPSLMHTSGYMTTSADTLETQEFIVPLQDQEEEIINRLTRGSSCREIVTIVGMAGIGKTTLARKVYDNPLIKKHFKRAWCCFSKEYRRREVLLKLLSDIAKTTDVIQDENDQDLDQMLRESHNKSDQDLVELLHKSLKGKRYLVVIDDIWDIEAWKELEMAFPNDSYENRILFTSRFDKVALEAQRDGAHPLRFLTEEESWELLQKKVFHEDECPKELVEVGQAIAKACKQLPLAVVAISGLLKRTGKDVDHWNHIKEDLNSRILEDPGNQCKLILDLSYNHLPDDLKPCFLYFAAFGGNNEVPIQKLIRLWIAEGFIRKVHEAPASLEDVAEGYVMDLIGRSLLMAAKKGSNGRVKACKVHDMLHNLCLAKVKEENFLKSIAGYEKLFLSSTRSLDYGVDPTYLSKSKAYNKYRLSICSKRKHFAMLKPFGSPVRTLLFFATADTYPRCPYNVSFISHNFKLLRVLDIESINMGSSFPEGIMLLDPLRYLAVCGDINLVPSRIANLWNLETFIVKGLTANVILPNTIWSMSRLRHLHVNNGAMFNFPDENHISFSQLDNLVTLSSPVLYRGEDAGEIMNKFPELKKLRCTFSPTQQSGNNKHFLVLDFLMKLESLKILYYGNESNFCEFRFPSNLQKLSLSGFSLTWDCISAIGALSKLEVLSLVSITFDSPIWEMRENEFSELKILKLEYLEIVEWNASSDHLPSLERLVLRSCKQLQKVPSSFGEICTLQMIELLWCSSFAESSLETIKNQQLELLQNPGFKTTVNDPPSVLRSSL